MSDTAVQRFYRFHAHVYDLTRWMILHGRRRAVAQMQLRPNSRVLEVGCGTGLNFRHLIEPLDPRAGRLVGLDFSEDMLAKARKRVEAAGWQNVDLIADDATQMNLGQSFDGILFAYSITMIPDWPKALERAREHLKPGGRMVVLDFSTFDGWGPLASAARGWLRLNHVETKQPYIETMRELFGEIDEYRWMGGYNFTATGQRRLHGSSD